MPRIKPVEFEVGLHAVYSCPPRAGESYADWKLRCAWEQLFDYLPECRLFAIPSEIRGLKPNQV